MCKRELSLGNLHTSAGARAQPRLQLGGRTWPRSLGLSRGRAEAGQEAGCTAIKGREGDSGRKGRRSECRWPLRRGWRERPSLARLHSSSYFTLYALRQSTCPRPTCQSGGGVGSESGGEGRGTHPAHLCLDRERNRNSNSEHSRRGGYSPHASRHWVGSYAPLNEDI